MKSGLLRSVLLGVPLMTAPLGGFAQTTFEGFEDASAFTFAGNDINTHAATVTLEDDTTQKTEGSKALKVTYNYSGTAYFEIELKKEFNPPVDLAEAVQFSIDVKSNLPASDHLLFLIGLESSNGNTMQMFPGFAATMATDRFTRWNFALSECRWGGWVSSNLNSLHTHKIKSIKFYLQQRDTVPGPGTAEVWIDNFQIYNSSSRQEEVIIDDFTYADDAAMQSKWSTFVQGDGAAAAVSLGTNLAGSGASGRLELTIPGQYLRSGTRYTFDTPRDFSQFKAFALNFKGDSTLLPAAHPRYLGIGLRDTAGSEAFWYSNSDINSADNGRLILFNDLDARVGSPALQEDNWDPAGNTSVTNMASIASFTIYSQDGNTDGYPSNFALEFDKITAYRSFGLPSMTEIDTADVSDWTVY